MQHSSKTVIVSFAEPNAAGEYTVVTFGRSVLEAAAKALDRFNSDCWKGPRPSPETVLSVGLVASRAPYNQWL